MADFGAIGGFDANQVKPSEAFAALPAGDYDVVITESSWETNKKQNGKFLKLKLQVINGPYQNRILWDRLNLLNPSEQAVQIAKGTLSAICRAVGVLTPRDSAELHNRPLKVTVKVGKDAESNPTNEIKGYKSRHVGAPPAVASQPPQAPAPVANQYQAPATSGQATPW